MVENYNEHKWEQLNAWNKIRDIEETIYDNHSDKEEYLASQHWVNNPLIKPVNKTAMFDTHVAYANHVFKEKLFTVLREHEYVNSETTCSCQLGENNPEMLTFDGWLNHVETLTEKM